eukprot:CAMPEP_0183326112 /NCGR_PEP_ID=MMETSP0160_2-20130417/81390_1 /TAXON_ID=2839 ORGANISM="Odontella Sinensis, Strain Grunow 1884" /NCGR_SAMPLE_ID=MMETSP0160_2 /ASSEMBLY_ACC=CAM_ASM_000250 /LENGTH=32 /DNA_ID= /DNA_START= /DNA_END= /DNA_ORIENTATION=
MALPPELWGRRRSSPVEERGGFSNRSASVLKG